MVLERGLLTDVVGKINGLFILCYDAGHPYLSGAWFSVFISAHGVVSGGCVFVAVALHLACCAGMVCLVGEEAVGPTITSAIAVVYSVVPW